MKKVAIFNVAILCLLFGIAANAEQDKRENERERPTPNSQKQLARPVQQSHSQQGARPGQNQARPQQQTYGGAYHGGVQSSGPTFGGVHHSGVPQHQGQVRAGFVQSRAGSWQNEHQTWSQRGGYNGYHVPDNRFKQYFGRDHFFRIGGLPLVFVGGQPRFQYDGYWVTFMDPWPEGWAPNWYEADDVYLDYNGDGYYVYDRLHPEFPIAVTITF